MLQLQEAAGQVSLNGKTITSQKDIVGSIGLVPQFSVAHEHLNVLESIRYTLRIHRKLDKASLETEAQRLLDIVGLGAQKQNRVNELSGGQLRRLGLAMGLAPRPKSYSATR